MQCTTGGQGDIAVAQKRQQSSGKSFDWIADARTCEKKPRTAFDEGDELIGAVRSQTSNAQ
jgi:hypothetical protein